MITSAGQPWSVKNQGELIKFGGIYPTVQDNAGDFYSSGTVVPYQYLKPRRYYKKHDQYITRSTKFAGGRRVLASNFNTVIPGGYWENGKKKSVSFTDKCIYIGGKYGAADSMLSSGFEIHAVCLAPASLGYSYWAAFDPYVQNYRNTLILIEKKFVSGSWQYNLKICAVILLSDTAPTFSFLACATVALPGCSANGYYSKFNFSANRLAIFDQTISGAITTAQSVKLLTFASDYLTFSNSTIYSITPQKIHTTTTSTETGGNWDWSWTTSGSGSLVSGGPTIIAMQMESESIGLAEFKIDSYSYSFTGSSVSLNSSETVHKSGGSSSTSTTTVGFSLQIKKLEFSGASADWSAESVSYTQTGSNTMDYTYPGDNVTTTGSGSNPSANLNPLYFSAEKQILFREKISTSVTSSSGGSGTVSTWSGSSTTNQTQTRSYDVFRGSAISNVYSDSTTSTSSGAVSYPSGEIATLSSMRITISDTAGDGQIQAIAAPANDGNLCWADTFKLALICCRIGKSSARVDRTVCIDKNTGAFTVESGRVDIVAGQTYLSQIGISGETWA